MYPSAYYFQHVFQILLKFSPMTHNTRFWYPSLNKVIFRINFDSGHVSGHVFMARAHMLLHCCPSLSLFAVFGVSVVTLVEILHSKLLSIYKALTF